MIARLSGTVLEKHPMRVVIDVGGVGYDVHVPLSSFAAVGDAGSRLTLRVHTHVREDALVLYGFGSALEQLVFERLIAVSGIGPKLALSVLPGIGRKTAERIVLELKDKLAAMTPAGAIMTPAGPREDLVSALLNLGYHRPLAEKAVDRALQDGADRGFEPLLRSALKVLSR